MATEVTATHGREHSGSRIGLILGIAGNAVGTMHVQKVEASRRFS